MPSRIEPPLSRARIEGVFPFPSSCFSCTLSRHIESNNFLIVRLMSLVLLLVRCLNDGAMISKCDLLTNLRVLTISKSSISRSVGLTLDFNQSKVTFWISSLLYQGLLAFANLVHHLQQIHLESTAQSSDNFYQDSHHVLHPYHDQILTYKLLRS